MWHVAALRLGHMVQCGVSTTATKLCSALWQQSCGSRLWGHCRGLGRSSKGGGGQRDESTAALSRHGDILVTFQTPTDKGLCAVTSNGELECFGYFKNETLKMDGVLGKGLNLII